MLDFDSIRGIAKSSLIIVGAYHVLTLAFHYAKILIPIRFKVSFQFNKNKPIEFNLAKESTMYGDLSAGNCFMCGTKIFNPKNGYPEEIKCSSCKSEYVVHKVSPDVISVPDVAPRKRGRPRKVQTL